MYCWNRADESPRTVRPGRRSAWLVPFVLFCVAATSGCLSEDSRSFALSRSFYTEEHFEGMSAALESANMEALGETSAMVFVLALPFAVDLAILPVTMTLDVADWAS